MQHSAFQGQLSEPYSYDFFTSYDKMDALIEEMWQKMLEPKSAKNEEKNRTTQPEC